MTGSGKRSRELIVAVAAAGILAILLLVTPGGSPATAGPAAGETLTVPDAVERSCFERIVDGGAGVASYELTSPELGYLDARLRADSGDWDLAVFDAESGESVAAGASRGASEVATGWVFADQGLIVQACRLDGDSATATVSANVEAIDVSAAAAETPSLVKVLTPTEAAEDKLASLGLDTTEHAVDDGVAVVLHGASDERALADAGLEHEVLVADLAAQSRRNLRADERSARERERTALPSGRTGTYRQLPDYQQELKDLADDNPDLVTPITLNHTTYEGREVEGIEITTFPGGKRDGKPVFLMMGLHHAREWPSGEHALEWAYELINGYRNGDQPLKSLVESTRTIIVPVVNPDGFNSSRTAGEAQLHGEGQSGDALVNFVSSPGEYRRKNCRTPNTESGLCPTGASVGAAETGVDPNRNYGGYWGGPGADATPQSAIYRGSGPFSEPDTQNVRELVSERAVVTLITNHTFSNLVLRPPGIAVLGDSPDEPVYQQFGADMTAENGYLNLHGFELYDTSGTTEDWTYTATAGLGFTFEIGCNQGDGGTSFDPEAACRGNFHPPYEQMVDEYEGDGPAAQNVGGDGNRAAYVIAQQSTRNANRHSLLTGSAPPNAILRVERDVATPTWEGHTGGEVDNPGPPFLDDTLSSEMKVRSSGNFNFHINPSTSPFVAQDIGREQDGGPPQETINFSGDNTTTTPPVGCLDFETEDPACWNDHPFEIDATADNESATVKIEWASPSTDWDMKVFIDGDGDGTSDREPASNQIAQSAQGPTTSEETTFVNPETGSGKLQPGKYVVRVINFAASDPATSGYNGSISFDGPQPFVAGTTTAWKLTCSLGGEVRATTNITIGRGGTRNLDLANSCAANGGGGGGGGGSTPTCQGEEATIVGTNGADNLVGTPGRDVIVGLAGDDVIKGAGSGDVICGNRGQDVIDGNKGWDQIRGNRGGDRLQGGNGKDTLGGGRGPDTLRGGDHADVIRGHQGNDDARGHHGPDRINGLADRDNVHGGSGDDAVRGGGGDDFVAGGRNDDLVGGGPGNDTCRAGGGNDQLRSCES